MMTMMMMMIIKMRLGGGEGINYESGRNSGICTNVLMSLDEELMIIIYLRITQFQMSNNMISTNDERDTLTSELLEKCGELCIGHTLTLKVVFE